MTPNVSTVPFMLADAKALVQDKEQASDPEIGMQRIVLVPHLVLNLDSIPIQQMVPDDGQGSFMS